MTTITAEAMYTKVCMTCQAVLEEKVSPTGEPILTHTICSDCEVETYRTAGLNDDQILKLLIEEINESSIMDN